MLRSVAVMLQEALLYQIQYIAIYGQNIDIAKKANLTVGKSALLQIYNAKKPVYSSQLKFVKTFGQVKAKAPLIYINSIGNLAISLNQDNFAKKYNIKPGYTIKLKFLDCI